MALITVSGLADNVQQETEVYGAQSSAYTGATRMHSRKLINFRVGNKPVTMKLKSTIDIAPGDSVTAVGTDKRGILQAVAVRNDNTGVVYAFSPLLLIGAGVVVTLIGIAMLSIVIGFVFAPMGVYLTYKGLQTRKAVAMLASSPLPAGAG